MDKEIRDFMRNIGENACMASGIITFAESHYEKIRGQLLPKYRSKAVAAYAIYEALNRFEAPRMAEEIQYYSGVDIKDIWQIESALIFEKTLSDPLNYVHRFCQLLNLTFSMEADVKRKLGDMLTHLPIGNLHCNCLVAVVLYLLCKKTKLKLTLRKICDACKISATSVHRVIRNLKEQHFNEITNHEDLLWMGSVIRQV